MLLIALSLSLQIAYSQEIPIKLQREVIKMNNDLNAFHKENRSLKVLMSEYENQILDCNKTIDNYIIIAKGDSLIIQSQRSTNDQLMINLDSEKKKTKFWRTITLGAVVTIPVAFVVGSLMAIRYQL